MYRHLSACSESKHTQRCASPRTDRANQHQMALSSMRALMSRLSARSLHLTSTNIGLTRHHCVLLSSACHLLITSRHSSKCSIISMLILPFDDNRFSNNGLTISQVQLLTSYLAEDSCPITNLFLDWNPIYSDEFTAGDSVSAG